MGSSVLRIGTFKNNSGSSFKDALGAAMIHNYRLHDVPTADPERKSLNRELIQLPNDCKDYLDFYEKRIRDGFSEKAPPIRSNSIRCVEFVLSYGSHDMDNEFPISRWAEKSTEFLRDFWGRENIASAVLHMDEGTPHIHAIAVPITKDGSLSFRQYAPNSASFGKIQERYYAYVAEFGLEPPCHSTTRGHKTQKEFWALAGSTEEKKLPVPLVDEDVAAYYERAELEHKKQMYTILQKLIKEKTDHDKLDDLTAANRRLYEKNQALEKELLSKKEELAITRRHIKDVQRQALREGMEKASSDMVHRLGCSLEDAEKLVSYAQNQRQAFNHYNSIDPAYTRETYDRLSHISNEWIQEQERRVASSDLDERGEI